MSPKKNSATTNPPAPKYKGRRGRRPRSRYSADKSLLNLNYEEENIILHLPISPDKAGTEFEDRKILEYSPEIVDPIPYDPQMTQHSHPFGKKESAPHSTFLHLEDSSESAKDDPTSAEPDFEIGELRSDQGEAIDIVMEEDSFLQNMKGGQFKRIMYLSTQNQQQYKKNKVTKTMQSFEKFNLQKTVPPITSIYCWWCSHPFETTPFVLPLKYMSEAYHVTGCFCSPECAAAYNFETYADKEDVFEHYSLLNTLYRRVYDKNQVPIKFAPPRQALAIFGGPMSVEKFRNSCHNYHRDCNLVMPPMISVIPQIEEVMVNYVSSKSSLFIPLDEERVSKADEDLRLRRNKSTKEKRNTLERCMNLTYKMHKS